MRGVLSGQTGGDFVAGSGRLRQVRQRVRGVLSEGARAAQTQAAEKAVIDLRQLALFRSV